MKLSSSHKYTASCMSRIPRGYHVFTGMLVSNIEHFYLQIFACTYVRTHSCTQTYVIIIINNVATYIYVPSHIE